MWFKKYKIGANKNLPKNPSITRNSPPKNCKNVAIENASRNFDSGFLRYVVTLPRLMYGLLLKIKIIRNRYNNVETVAIISSGFIF